MLQVVVQGRAREKNFTVGKRMGGRTHFREHERMWDALRSMCPVCPADVQGQEDRCRCRVDAGPFTACFG